MWEMKDWGRVGRWAPQLALHSDAKHHSSMLHFYNSFCAICSTPRTHSSHEKLWGYMASEKSPRLSSHVSNCTLSVIFKRNRATASVLSQCEMQTPFAASTDVLFVSQLIVVATLQQGVLGLQYDLWGLDSGIFDLVFFCIDYSYGVQNSTTATSNLHSKMQTTHLCWSPCSL